MHWYKLPGPPVSQSPASKWDPAAISTSYYYYYYYYYILPQPVSCT